MFFRSRLVSSALLFFSLFFIPAATSAAMDVTSVTLPNGLRVITAPSHSVAIVAIDIWVRAGTRRQAIDQQGVAHFLEHLLFKGTPTRPGETQIDGAIEDLGGSIDAATSYDWAHFYTIVPSTGFGTALDVLGDSLQHATLSSESLENERGVIINEIARNDDSHIQQLLEQVHAMAYPESHPYHYSIMGDADDVQQISRQEILDFYHTFYVPNNVTLVVSGDVTPDQVLAVAQKVFGDWKFSTSLPADTGLPVPPLTGIRRQVFRKPAEQTYLMMAFNAPSVKDQPDVWTMDVLMTLLGQGAGSRLDTDLHRKKHIVTSISTDFLTQRDNGLLTISATMPTGSLEDAETAILKEIETFRTTPVSDDELAGAKNMLLASYLFDVETDSGHADSLGFYDSIESFEYDTHYIDHLNSVSADDLIRVALKYLTPDNYTFVALVPPADAINAAQPRSTGQFALTAGKAGPSDRL